MKEMEIAGVADVIALLVMQLEVFLALPSILRLPSALMSHVSVLDRL